VGGKTQTTLLQRAFGVVDCDRDSSGDASLPHLFFSMLGSRVAPQHIPTCLESMVYIGNSPNKCGIKIAIWTLAQF
jgi:hypothetical protein